MVLGKEVHQPEARPKIAAQGRPLAQFGLHIEAGGGHQSALVKMIEARPGQHRHRIAHRPLILHKNAGDKLAVGRIAQPRGGAPFGGNRIVIIGLPAQREATAQVMATLHAVPDQVGIGNLLTGEVLVGAVVAVLVVVAKGVIEAQVFASAKAIAAKNLGPLGIDAFAIDRIIAAQLLIGALVEEVAHAIAAVLIVVLAHERKRLARWPLEGPLGEEGPAVQVDVVPKAVAVVIVKVIDIGVVDAGVVAVVLSALGESHIAKGLQMRGAHDVGREEGLALGLLGDDIDDPGQRLRAVERAAGAFDDLYAVDDLRGDAVEAIDRGEVAIHGCTVHEHGGVGARQAVDAYAIGEADTAGDDFLHAVDHGDALHEIGGGDGLLQELSGDDVDFDGRFGDRGRLERACDHDLIEAEHIFLHGEAAQRYLLPGGNGHFPAHIAHRTDEQRGLARRFGAQDKAPGFIAGAAFAAALDGEIGKSHRVPGLIQQPPLNLPTLLSQQCKG